VLLANGDVKRLAVWLAVDGGPEPDSISIQPDIDNKQNVRSHLL